MGDTFEILSVNEKVGTVRVRVTPEGSQEGDHVTFGFLLSPLTDAMEPCWAQETSGGEERAHVALAHLERASEEAAAAWDAAGARAGVPGVQAASLRARVARDAARRGLSVVLRDVADALALSQVHDELAVALCEAPQRDAEIARLTGERDAARDVAQAAGERLDRYVRRCRLHQASQDLLFALREKVV